MLVCPGWISRDSSPDSSEGRCSCWKPATSRACCIFPGFSSHLGTELLSENHVFLTWCCLKPVSAVWLSLAEVGGGGWILHPRPDQEEGATEGKVIVMQNP